MSAEAERPPKETKPSRRPGRPKKYEEKRTRLTLRIRGGFAESLEKFQKAEKRIVEAGQGGKRKRVRSLNTVLCDAIIYWWNNQGLPLLRDYRKVVVPAQKK